MSLCEIVFTLILEIFLRFENTNGSWLAPICSIGKPKDSKELIIKKISIDVNSLLKEQKERTIEVYRTSSTLIIGDNNCW